MICGNINPHLSRKRNYITKYNADGVIPHKKESYFNIFRFQRIIQMREPLKRNESTNSLQNGEK